MKFIKVRPTDPTKEVIDDLNNGTIKSYYFTFGQKHVHPDTLEPMLNYYVKVAAPNAAVARDQMFKIYGDKWAFQYTDETFKSIYCPAGCYEEHMYLTEEQFEAFVQIEEDVRKFLAKQDPTKRPKIFEVLMLYKDDVLLGGLKFDSNQDANTFRDMYSTLFNNKNEKWGLARLEINNE